MDMKETIRDQFTRHFGNEGQMYASAGRINLIGERCV